ENGISLSPAYDLLNVNLLNPADDEELALTLNGKKKKIKLNDFVGLAESLHIPQKAMENSLKKFTAKNKQVDFYIESSFLNEELKDAFKEIWIKKQKIFQH
ncbi:MAG TPA: type II toxin-antitoxin system HipA family toxin, partial [Cytophagaceae bacterium]